MKKDTSYTESDQVRPTQRRKSFDEKLDELKQNFARNAVKWDFLKKSDGFNYVIGYVGLDEDSSEWRVWKTADFVDKGTDAQFLFKSYDKNKAQEEYKKIITK